MGHQWFSKYSLTPDIHPVDNPLKLFTSLWYGAKKLEKYDPTAAALATSGKKGPSVRIVLIKEIVEEGIIFYTNYNSRKAKELLRDPRCALVLWWPITGIQIRIEGKAEKIAPELNDSYFVSRPKRSQAAAIVSKQSEILHDYNNFVREVEKVYEDIKNKDIKAPSYWGGFVVIPERIEFFYHHSFRLHKRFLYSKRSGIWQFEGMLYP